MTYFIKRKSHWGKSIISPVALFLVLTAGSLFQTQTAHADHLNVTVRNNDITVNGDETENVLRVTILTESRRQTCQILYSGSIEVRGIEATIDPRRKTATFEVEPYIDDLRINTYGGSDSVTVRRFRALGSNGDIVINGGNDSDEILVEDSTARDIIVNGGYGNDNLEVLDSDATGWLAIRGQFGGNIITAAGCQATNVGLRGGESADTITADYVSAEAFYVYGYGGSDFVELGHYVQSNNSLPTFNATRVEIDTANGNDQVYGHYIKVSSMFIETGNGRDEIFLPIIEGDVLEIETGSNNDRVYVDGMVSELPNSSRFYLDTGSGDDNVELGFGFAPIAFNLNWMEVRLGSGSDQFYNYVSGLVGDYVWDGGSGDDAHMFLPGITGYADPWKTLNFE